MVQIGWYEVLGTVLVVILAVVVVLLFIVVGWFVVWKLILSHFRFFREIFGMDNHEEKPHSPAKNARNSQEPSSMGSSSASDNVPAHIRRRQQRLEKEGASDLAAGKT